MAGGGGGGGGGDDGGGGEGKWCAGPQPGEDIRPDAGPTEAIALAARLYGLPLTASVTTLNAYDDRNFHLQVAEGSQIDNYCPDGYILKILNSFDSKNPSIIQAQNELMLFLGTKGIICSQPIKNVHGMYYSIERFNKNPQDDSSSKEHIVRLLTFQPGVTFYNVPCTTNLLYEIGEYVANFDLLVKDFHHTAYENHKNPWILEAVLQLKNFTFALDDTFKFSLVTEVIQTFENDVEPLIPLFEKGLLHGDFNEQNILVKQSPDGEYHIHGIIDFGDSHISCYIFELAVTICYMMLQSKLLDPLDAPAHVIAGYITKRNIPDNEFSILKKCVCARLCQSLVMGAYSYKQDPTNQYVLTTSATGWKLLKDLWKIPEEKLYKRWNSIIKSYS